LEVTKETSNGTALELSVTERKIIVLLRSMQFGELTVIIKDGHPVHVRQERTLKLE